MTNGTWNRLQADVIAPGLCTQCGSCVGLSEGCLQFQEKRGIPLVTRTGKEGDIPQAAYDACPARFCPYPALNDFAFGKRPSQWLCGVVEKSFIGHATEETVRKNGASGGVISAILLHLLETGRITGAVCLQLGKTRPWLAEPVIARSREDVLACAQSVYSLTPVNTILAAMGKEEGPLAYVGLPDQVASIRKLQRMGHSSVRNVRYVLGPYMGTQMTFEAIRSFLRSHGVRSEEEIASLRYRAGEWPGHLEIALKDGRLLRAEKFHYNYLIPFFITSGSLQLVDFTNELTDISVGDAWSPQYEKRKGGFSVVLARSERAMELLADMRGMGLLALDELPFEQVLDMHGHMLDFKKRGSFIRNARHRIRPAYGYAPASIPLSRKAVEAVISALFALGRTTMARWVVEHIPLRVLGPCFNGLRKAGKALSKPTKRRGLRNMSFAVES
ncbi:MAG: coenzyme F420 hydrogenase/dehydrogenase beta subunit N-terminal domain-containing protein [Patescibacteria group bacterium]